MGESEIVDGVSGDAKSGILICVGVEDVADECRWDCDW